jgi:phosphopentomutase
MMKTERGFMKKAFILVLDGVGIGELPDARDYGDEGSNTIVNTAKALGRLTLPNLEKLGLGRIDSIPGVKPVENPEGSFGKMRERSKGKDSISGHWEIMGVIVEKPFPVYPHGFPPDLIAEFERRIGRKTLGNVVASGTEIIKRLGSEHIRTGYPIVYTSADSVFQIAAHEDVIPVNELYRICEIARELLRGEHEVARVIARPFAGSEGNFYRTPNRHDFAVKPKSKTVLKVAEEAGIPVVSVGKIKDLYMGYGITESFPTKSNREGLEISLRLLEERKSGIIMTNLVDFDMLWGHRNDIQGFANGLSEVDTFLPHLLEGLGADDLLIITADHGCDPTTPSTDHSREYVPLLVFGHRFRHGINLGIRETFADVGATVAEFLGLNWNGPGVSFLADIQA